MMQMNAEQGAAAPSSTTIALRIELCSIDAGEMRVRRQLLSISDYRRDYGSATHGCAAADSSSCSCTSNTRVVGTGRLVVCTECDSNTAIKREQLVGK